MQKNMLRGDTIKAGCGVATVIPDIDFETYSEAGYVFLQDKERWQSIAGPGEKGGLPITGTPVYAEHPTTEVLSLAYDLKDGKGGQIWLPSMPLPTSLFEYIATGEPLEAHNCLFEYFIWHHVCHLRYGWPPLPIEQLRDSMAKARAFSVPGKLELAGPALGLTTLKNKQGDALLRKYSRPRNPTKKDSSLRNRLELHPVDAAKLYNYNLDDIKAEAAVSMATTDLSPSEIEVFKVNNRINVRGCYVDNESLEACISIVEQAVEKYNTELRDVTKGVVGEASKLEKLREWLETQGVYLSDMQKATIADTVKNFTKSGGTPEAKRALEIRQILGSESVKKVYALKRQTSSNSRICDIFAYCGADRTGRFSGMGPQPQNLPSSGPDIKSCYACHKSFVAALEACPHCSSSAVSPAKGWGFEAVEDALNVIKTRSLDYVEHIYGDPLTVVSGSLRGLFCVSPGHSLIGSDYSAIEAVVLACLAGEEWRIEVFRTHGKIYEMTASEISGVPFEEFLAYKKQHGEDHPLRKPLGKVPELASGYQGWVGAWKAFGAEKYFEDDDAIADAVKKWRRANPMIKNFWYAVDEASKNAVQTPGQYFSYRDITFAYNEKDDILYCRLPSGRFLHYHEPRLTAGTKFGKPVVGLSYMGYNTDYKKGPKGWLRLQTYGGKLTENITQAVARDIMAAALVRLERAGYPIVLHVHDEAISELKDGQGSVEEFEKIMMVQPEWVRNCLIPDWPIKAAGGWRGHRFRKD